MRRATTTIQRTDPVERWIVVSTSASRSAKTSAHMVMNCIATRRTVSQWKAMLVASKRSLLRGTWRGGQTAAASMFSLMARLPVGAGQAGDIRRKDCCGTEVIPDPEPKFESGALRGFEAPTPTLALALAGRVGRL